MADTWITTAEAARLSGYTIQHVRHLVTTGAVKGQRWGRDWQVSRRSLLAYVRQVEKQGARKGRKPGS